MEIYLRILLFCSLISTIISKPTINKSACSNRPMCNAYCEYGNRLDTQGCPTCGCNSSPCENETPPLEGYSCGPTTDQSDCPTTYYCNDAYAVCCPRKVLETSNKN